MGKYVKYFDYKDLDTADLYVDAIYCSPRPSKGGYADDVLVKMLHHVRNTGGFIIPHRNENCTTSLIRIQAA